MNLRYSLEITANDRTMSAGLGSKYSLNVKIDLFELISNKIVPAATYILNIIWLSKVK